MYDDLRLHQTFTAGDYFHLDIELKWLRGVRLHRDVRFKFFCDQGVAGLEFRSIPEWPVMFQAWPGHLVDKFGPYFIISTDDADRSGIARLDPDGMALVNDIATELFTIISSLTNNPAAEITDAQELLREVIRVSDYIVPENAKGHAQFRHGASILPAPLQAQAEASARPQLLTNALQPIAALLSENQRLLQELQADASTGKELGVLESYLAKIRVDGVAKHADMKKKLDQVAENNTAIVTLINVYMPHAKTAAFTLHGNTFRRYASAWRDRWNSVMELLTAGGTFTTSELAFPKDFPAAVDGESAP